ncbi:unnamed protein product [Brassica oleracea]
MPNMRWDATVEALYLPFQVDGRNWIGVAIDIPHWCIHVVDCNPVCLKDEKLESLLQPIVVLLPLLILRNGGKVLNDAAMENPMPITRLDIPFLCEQTGLPCVATLVLMELYASQNLADAENITEDDLAIAAMTYAVETFSTFNPDHLQDFQDA